MDCVEFRLGWVWVVTINLEPELCWVRLCSGLAVTILTLSTNFREKADLEKALQASQLTTAVNDEFSVEGQDDMKCGVAKCYLSQKIWPNKTRLEDHR